MTLPLDEVRRLIAEGRASDLLFAVNTLGAQFGLTDAEVLAELKAGRLVAGLDGHRPATTREMWDVATVTFDDLVNWLSCGSLAAERARAHLPRVTIQ